MPLSKDDQKAAMRSAIKFGEAAGKLADSFRYQRLTSAEAQMRSVFWKVERAGFDARDVLDMMEENDG